MKKSLICLLAVSILLMGCVQNVKNGDSSLPSSAKMREGRNHTEYVSLAVKAESLEVAEDGKISLNISWENNTEHTVIYGAAYGIERLEGNRWISCAKQKEPSFIEIAYELEAGKTRVESYELTEQFLLSEPGFYRFTAVCHVHEAAQKSVPCRVWAEFLIEEEAAGNPAGPLSYRAQYIRTDSGAKGMVYPGVIIIRCTQELEAYYSTHRDRFDLERRNGTGKDTTIGFLDACDRYDEAFFQDKYLVLIRLEETSGSSRHVVTNVEQTEEGKIGVQIETKFPEIGTDDMAQWHIILELDRETEAACPEDVELYLYGLARYEATEAWENAHTHQTALLPQLVESPVTGFCGNIETTIWVDGESYTFSFEKAVALTAILINLNYDPDKVCDCEAAFSASLGGGEVYEIHLENSFVRCSRGQAELTSEQIETVQKIVQWAKESA